MNPKELFTAAFEMDDVVKYHEREETPLIELLQDIAMVILILWLIGKIFIAPISVFVYYVGLIEYTI